MAPTPSGNRETDGYTNILSILSSCGIRRFEANDFSHLHGSELQVIMPRDFYYLEAMPCLQRRLPEGLFIRRYDPETDFIGKNLAEEAAELANASRPQP